MPDHEEPDFVDESLKLAAEPYRTIIRRYQDEGVFAAMLKRTQEQYTLTDDQLDSVTLITFRAACDPDIFDSVKDTLIAEADLSYEQAVKIQRDIARDIILPIKKEGDALQAASEAVADRTPSSIGRPGEVVGESKIFESGGFVVTTERFVYGSKIVRLDDITGGALAFVDKGWKGTLIIAGIGLAMLMWGGAFWKFIGLVCFAAAYFFFKFTIERSLVLSVNGEGLHIKVETTELVNSLAEAINKGISARKSARAGALRDELSSLPKRMGG